jgi:hypothetical protein
MATPPYQSTPPTMSLPLKSSSAASKITLAARHAASLFELEDDDDEDTEDLEQFSRVMSFTGSQ